MNKRFESIDVFRGLTVMLMTIVNNPGDWGNIYAPFEHAEWHGCTPTDLVFPFFLFIVGVSTVLSVPVGADKKNTSSMKIWTRALRIFGLGFFLSFFSRIQLHGIEGLPLFAFRMCFVAMVTIIFLGNFAEKVKFYSALGTVVLMLFLAYSGIEAFETARIPGVLQRIAVVYLIIALLYKSMSIKSLYFVFGGLLLVYWMLMTLVEVPGFGAPNLDKGTNLAAWLDNYLLEGHLWSSSKTWDPEGILSTLPAICTGLFGIFIAQLLRGKEVSVSIFKQLMYVGIGAIILGQLWGLVFPINKALWTSSYVIYTGGLATVIIGVLYYLIEIKGSKSWTKPFHYFGVNPMVVFFFSGIIPRVLGMIKIPVGEGETQNLQSFLYNNLYADHINNQQTASLLGAFTYLLIWFLILAFFYRKNLIFKV